MVHTWSRLFRIPSDEATKLRINNHTAKIPNEAFIHLGNLVLFLHAFKLSFSITYGLSQMYILDESDFKMHLWRLKFLSERRKGYAIENSFALFK